jgi:hypothetical protein
MCERICTLPAIPGFGRLDESLERARIERTSGGCFVADKQGDLFV